ncbi:MAG: hypothetical protein ACOYOU_03125 [Kiritimatiellia bacterium]
MTTKTLTVVSWTARMLAVVGLLSIGLSCLALTVVVGRFDSEVVLPLTCVLLLLGIAAIPSRTLSKDRVLSGFAFVLSLIPLLLFVCVISQVDLAPVGTAVWWCDSNNRKLVTIFFVLTMGVCALPIALATADALARRGNPIEKLGRWTRIVLLAVGGMILILETCFLTL